VVKGSIFYGTIISTQPSVSTCIYYCTHPA
jgi:hypothetical protein